MPRWKIIVSPRSVWTSPYLARRPSPSTRARRAGSGQNPREPAGAGPPAASRRGSGGAPRARSPGHGRWFRLREARAYRRLRARIELPPSQGLAKRGAMTSDTVSFGYSEVPPEKKTRLVRDVFERVASRYDIMNDAMSGGLHRLWKDHFVGRVKPQQGEAILDMAGGTGDIAFRMAKRGADVTVADINPAMLAVGMERARKKGLDGRI